MKINDLQLLKWNKNQLNFVQTAYKSIGSVWK